MRKGVVLATMAVLVLLAPASAGAATYCVHAPSACPAGGLTRASVQTALNDAAATDEDDTVLIGAGDFQETVFQLPADSHTVEIAGAGRAATTLRYTDGGIDLTNPGSVLRDVTVRPTPADQPVWIALHGTGTFRRVEVIASPIPDSVGLEATGGPVTFEDASIDMRAAPLGEAIISGPAPAAVTVRGATIRGSANGRAIDLGGALTVERTQILGGEPGILTCWSQTTVVDSLIVSGGDGSAAIEAYGMAPCVPAVTTQTLSVRSSTIIGAGTAGGGIYWRAGSAGGQATVSDSVIRAGGTAVTADQPDPGTGSPVLTIDHTDVDPASVNHQRNAAISMGAGNRFGEPGFLDAAAGDYRLRFDSPLVDAGSATALALGETDLAGLARIVHGGRDIGAFEYQRRAPTVTAQWLITPLGVFPGTTVQLTATAADPDPGETPVLTWAFDDGGTTTGAAVAHAFAGVGDHTATVTATDPTGQTATAVVTVPVQAPLAPGSPPAVTLPSALTARGGVVGVGVRCRATPGTTCRGTVSLAVPVGKAGFRTIAHATYSVRAGATRTVRLRLSSAALRAARRAGHRALRLRATVTGGTGATRSVHVALRR